IINNTLHAARIFGDACVKLREYSVEGITLDRSRIDKFVGESLMLVTALSPVIGYDKASTIAHRAMEQNPTLSEAAGVGGFVSAEELDRIVEPKKMVGNPRRDIGMDCPPHALSHGVWTLIACWRARTGSASG